MKKNKTYNFSIGLRASVIALFTLITFSSQAQTITAPRLHCAKDTLNDIFLEWTNTTNACGAFEDYLIWYSSSPTGPFTILATVSNETQTTYLQVGANNGNTVYYYYMTAQYNCPGATTLSSDTINNLGPLPPSINYITVTDSEAEINWTKSVSPQTYGYVIYLVLGPNKFRAVATVYGATITDFIIPNSTPNDSAAKYTIASIDSCGHVGIVNTSYQQTISAGVTTNDCGGEGYILWSPYINWTGGVRYYKIYAVYNSGPAVLIDSTTNINDSFPYISEPTCVYVVGYQNGTAYTSKSNITCLPSNPQHPITNLYLHTATVVVSGVNELFYTVDSTSNVLSMTIERSDGTDGVNYVPIAVLNAPASLNGTLTYYDSSALNDTHSYYYKIIMRDNCGAQVTSNYAKTMLLQGNSYTNFVDEVFWDNYMNDSATVLNYTVQRNTPAGWLTIKTFNPPQPPNDYQESVQSLVGDSGTLCYVINATALLRLQKGITDTVTSRSNILCLDEIIKIGVPNAFAPEGKNNIFKPITRFTDNKSYTFQVFDRWGGLIFSTEDFATGWDGTYKGKAMPQGAYAYFIQVVDNLGERTEQKGTVMLIR